MSAPALPSWMRVTSDGVILSLKVQPRASKNELAGEQGAELKVRVTAPPVDSAANQAVVEFFAELLDLPRGSVTLIRGSTSRHKQLLIKNRPAEAIIGKLA